MLGKGRLSGDMLYCLHGQQWTSDCTAYGWTTGRRGLEVYCGEKWMEAIYT